MRVIAEFVDARTGRRYQPGEGGTINPPLTDAQVTQLKKAKCLEDGDEEKASAPGANKQTLVPLPSDKDLRKMNAAQLTALAASRGVDLTGKTKTAEMVQALQSSAQSGSQLEPLPAADVLQGMTLEALVSLAAARGVDVSACKTPEEAAAVLTASV